MEQRPTFVDKLHKKYPDLHRDPSVLRTVQRARKKRGESPEDIDLSKNSEGRIQDFLDYLTESIDPNNPRRAEKLRRFKEVLHKYCLHFPADIPNSYWKSVQESHYREGREVPEITEKLKQELAEPIINDQRESLDAWAEYLASPDAKYPIALKYWVIRNVLKMGRYDKEKKKFTDRYGRSISPFPDLNQEALALVVDAMEKKYANESPEFGYDIQDDTRQRFLAELSKENFPELYAIAIEEFKPISEELLKITNGQWKTFPQGSSPQALVDSLKNYGTGWCIRGYTTAARYLTDFNLEIFYSNNENGEPVVPRLVIVRFPDGRISEFRGVAKKEEHDQYIGPVVTAKLATLGKEGEEFNKSKADIDALDAIRQKMKEKQSLTREELIFLYEIDTKIQGFGYGPPKRVKDLRKERVDAGLLEQDMLTIFECTSEQIAHNQQEVKTAIEEGKEIRAYIGPLFPGIFTIIGHLEHLYTSFPESRMWRDNVTIGSQTIEELIREIIHRGVNITEYGNTC